MRQNPEAETNTSSLRGLAFSLGLAALTVAFYVISLSCLFPRFFHPLVPFHVDFYDYTGFAFVPFRSLFTYPRIATALTMSLLGHLGLKGLMAGGIAISLSGVALTIAFVQRLVRPSVWPFVGLSCCYLVLLFAHPDFYVEHRHDLPAEISYLALLLALHSGLWWMRTGKTLALAAATLSCFVFALSKETFFLSGPCLLLTMHIFERKRRRSGVWIVSIMLLSEAASFAWTHHVNSPFVQLSAAANAPYHLDLSAKSVAHIYGFYLRRLFTPASAMFLLLAPFLMARSRECVLSLGFLAAGLLALLPHALLPNHVYAEYAWIAAPLVFAPILLAAGLPSDGWRHPALLVLALAATALSFVGLDGYLHRYREPGQLWGLTQEKRIRAFLASWPQLRAIPEGSRVLITGLETPFLPWASPVFAAHEFGPPKEWLVLAPVGAQDPHLPHLRVVTLREWPVAADTVASYAESGHLVSLRSIEGARTADLDPTLLIPELAKARHAANTAPSDRIRLLRVIDEDLLWGAYQQADAFLVQAKRAGLGQDEWICFMAGKLAIARNNWPLAVENFTCSAHQSPGTQGFQSALRDARSHLSVPR